MPPSGVLVQASLVSLLALAVQPVANVNWLAPKPSSSFYTGRDPDITDIRTLITRKGYPFEVHRVVTSDGYVIELHRIPRGRNSRGRTRCKPPVLLMSGLTGDSSNWVLDFSEQSLGYVLADHGYDVWLGNVRGNAYGKQHRRLKVRSPAFWNFTFHEHATLDLPAQIDYVLRATCSESIPYVGVSQGTLIMFSMLSEKPEYNSKVKAFAALAPFNKLTGVDIPAMSIAAPYADKYLTSAYQAFLFEVLQRGAFYMPLAQKFCGLPTRALCALVGDGVGNLGSKYINQSRIPVYLHFVPGGTSAKNMFHYAQLVTSGRPQKFDYGPERNKVVYGQPEPPEYQLKNLKTGVGLFWSRGDHVITPPNVRELIQSLGTRLKFNHYIDDPDYTHVNFLVSLNNPDVLFKGVISFLDSSTDQ